MNKPITYGNPSPVVSVTASHRIGLGSKPHCHQFFFSFFYDNLINFKEILRKFHHFLFIEFLLFTAINNKFK